MAEADELQSEILVETENYMVSRTRDPEGEVVYHIEMFNMTVHFFQEEWDEFKALMEEVSAAG
jgi:hypothetical protein